MSADPEYVRPLLMTGAARPAQSFTLAGGWTWFSDVEVLRRGAEPVFRPARSLSQAVLARLTRPRPDLCGLTLDRPRIMGILNPTPDSFSDGGALADAASAVEAGVALAAAGADILDIGGESTRPGAAEVPADAEAARVLPVFAGLRQAGLALPLSADTRKASVARSALGAGADIVNDVSALGHDAEMAGLVAKAGVPVVLMHAQGTPATMQADPAYADVVMDVYDALATAAALAEAAGIDRMRIVLDPGIGFGKTLEHNLSLLRRLAVFHALGYPILLGASRKRFIGALSGEDEPRRRGPGSLAVAVAAMAQGVQILRVHDVAETAQARAVWLAVVTGKG